MLDIYAQTFMIASRGPRRELREVPAAKEPRSRRWLRRPVPRGIDAAGL